MKRYQIHLYLKPELMGLLKEKSKLWGLTSAQYVKFILVRELDAHPRNLNIKSYRNQGIS